MKTLAIIAVFLTFGAFAASAQSNKTVTSATKVQSMDLPTPEQSAKSTINKLKVMLDLTDAQVAELTTFINSNRETAANTLDVKEKTALKKLDQKGGYKAAFNAKLKEVLTPQQSAKMTGNNKSVIKKLE